MDADHDNLETIESFLVNVLGMILAFMGWYFFSIFAYLGSLLIALIAILSAYPFAFLSTLLAEATVRGVGLFLVHLVFFALSGVIVGFILASAQFLSLPHNQEKLPHIPEKLAWRWLAWGSFFGGVAWTVSNLSLQAMAFARGGWGLSDAQAGALYGTVGTLLMLAGSGAAGALVMAVGETWFLKRARLGIADWMLAVLLTWTVGWIVLWSRGLVSWVFSPLGPLLFSEHYLILFPMDYFPN